MAVLGSPLIIDGSHGEGGGALVRAALVMATLTQQPLRIVNVRGGTSVPGLNPEDLTVLRALAASASAECLGAECGASSLSYLPTRRPKSLNTTLDIADGPDGPGFANALVVLSALVPVLARTGMYSEIGVRGETYGPRVLGYDYFAHVTVPALRRFGLHAVPDLLLAGFGRGTRGEVHLEVEPSGLSGVDWHRRGALQACRAVVSTSSVAETVGRPRPSATRAARAVRGCGDRRRSQPPHQPIHGRLRDGVG